MDFIIYGEYHGVQNIYKIKMLLKKLFLLLINNLNDRFGV